MEDLGKTFTLILILSFAIETVLARVRAGSADAKSSAQWAGAVVLAYVFFYLTEISILGTKGQLDYLLTAIVVAAGVDHIAAFRKKLDADTEVTENVKNEPGSENITINGTLELDKETQEILKKALSPAGL